MSTTTPEKYCHRKTNGTSNYITETYSYNPFTNKLPSTTEHWKYIKYTPKNSFNIQTPINHLLDTNDIVSGSAVWMLYAGPGGEYGGHSKRGGGGGGGGGEVVLSVVKTSDINPNNKTITCNIQQLNPNRTGTNTFTTISYSKFTPATATVPATTAPITLSAKAGYNGGKGSDNYTGANGGSGGGYNGVGNGQVMETFNTTTSTTIKFGSGGGGGGGRYKTGNTGEVGNYTTLSFSPITIAATATTPAAIAYQYIYYTNNTRQCEPPVSSPISFDIPLNNIVCDKTGTARITLGGQGGGAANNGQNAQPGFIMFFYKTTTPLTENNPRIKFNQSFPPFLKIYNYNPFTQKIPGQIDNDLNKPGEDWVYYKYDSNDNNTQFNFKHTIQNIPAGENVWIVYAGAGGNNGGYKKKCGCGGGGGPGETVLSVIENVTENLSLTCKIGSINYEIENSNNNSKTTITYGSTTLTANEGFAGHSWTEVSGTRNSGANGGVGGGMARNATTTQNTSTDTTFRFGSGYGGGGGSIYGAGNGQIGNQTVCSLKSGTTYDYKYVSNNKEVRAGAGCVVDFNKTLKGYTCDRTGTVNLLVGGGGGKSDTAGVGENGYDGPPGFIMIFHKTTKLLTQNINPPANFWFGYNPLTNYRIQSYSKIHENVFYYLDSGSQTIPMNDYNTLFKDSSHIYILGAGGGGGGGNTWWNGSYIGSPAGVDTAYSNGGGGGGGGGYAEGKFNYTLTTDIGIQIGKTGETHDKPLSIGDGKDGGNGDATIINYNGYTITLGGGKGGKAAKDRCEKQAGGDGGIGIYFYGVSHGEDNDVANGGEGWGNLYDHNHSIGRMEGKKDRGIINSDVEPKLFGTNNVAISYGGEGGSYYESNDKYTTNFDIPRHNGESGGPSPFVLLWGTNGYI